MRGLEPPKIFGWINDLIYIETLVNNQMFVVQAVVSVASSSNE
jgi:hypothetical protein